MLTWLGANWGTLLVAAVLAAAVYFIIRKLVRDKRAGRHCCGSSCAGCSACAGCASGTCGKP